ncbi:hypothetical protein Tco_0513872 [Tanacetum coccineum]
MFTVSEDPFVQEPVDENSSTKQLVFFGEMGAALKELSRPKWILLLITCLNWIAWFPFLLFDTNWIGKEVCRGKVGEGQAGETLQPRPRCGVKRLWGGVNFLLAVCLAMTVLVTKMAKSSREFTTLADGTTIIQPPSSGVKSGALAIFVVTSSVPCALASIFSNNSGAGQRFIAGCSQSCNSHTSDLLDEKRKKMKEIEKERKKADGNKRGYLGKERKKANGNKRGYL